MSRRTILTLTATVCVILAGLYSRGFFSTITTPTTQTITISTSTTATVIRVVDGDTFVIRAAASTSEEKVRLLGINTPETVDPRRPVQCFGKEASAHLKTLLTNKTIRLEPDPTNTDRDAFQRLLRYAYLEDGTDVNAAMITDGYAYAYTKFPFQKRDAYLKLQSAARAAGRGLWSATTCAGKLN